MYLPAMEIGQGKNENEWSWLKSSIGRINSVETRAILGEAALSGCPISTFLGKKDPLLHLFDTIDARKLFWNIFLEKLPFFNSIASF